MIGNKSSAYESPAAASSSKVAPSPGEGKEGKLSFNPKNLSANQRRATLNELASWDADGDGHVSLEEMQAAARKSFRLKRTNRQLGKIIVLVSCFSTVFCGVLLGLMFFANEASKETRTVGRKLESLDGHVVETENPKSYATLLDIPHLPMRVLDSISKFNFATEDGAAHMYVPSGVQQLPNQKVVEIHFSVPGRRLRITSTNATLVIDADGYEKNIAVLVPDTETVQRARMLLSQRGLNERCTASKRACIHTWDEIIHIHREQGRMLQEGTVPGYTVFAADANTIAAMDGPSAFDAIEAAFDLEGSEYEYEDSAAKVVTFSFLERCENYGLSRCIQPAPLGSLNSSMEGVWAPYPGMVARDGFWYFKDEVEYYKSDALSRLSIKYAHDGLSKQRAHIVMLGVNGNYFEFDEIVDDDGSKIMTNCHGSTADQTGDVLPSLEGRRMLSEDDFMHAENIEGKLSPHDKNFHEIVRRKLRGFGVIAFNSVKRGRALETENEDDDDVTLEADLTSQNVHGCFPLTRENLGDLYDNMTDVPEQLVEMLDASSVVCVPSELPDDKKGTLEVAQYLNPLFKESNVDYSWPDATLCREAPIKFLDGIPRRADLDGFFDDAGRRLEETMAARAIARQFQVVFNRIEQFSKTVKREAVERGNDDRRLSNMKPKPEWRAFLEKQTQGFFEDLQNEVVDEAQAKVIGMYSSTGTSLQSLSPPCSMFRKSSVQFIEHCVNNFQGPNSAIDMHAKEALSYLERPKEIKSTLAIIKSVLKVIIPLLNSMKPIPVFGAVCTVISTALKVVQKLIEKAIETLGKAVTSIEKSKLKYHIERIEEENGKIGEYIWKAMVQHMLYSSKLIAMDQVCPNDATSTQCSAKGTALNSANDVMDQGIALMRTAHDAVAKVTKWLYSFEAVIQNPVYKKISDFFTSIETALKPVKAFLSKKRTFAIKNLLPSKKRVCSMVPVPCSKCCRKIWCGKTCKWKKGKVKCKNKHCNVHYPDKCPKRVCANVLVPFSKTWKITFTLMDVVNGALSVLSVAEKAFDVMLNALWKQLPMPDISIPGMDILDFPKVPELDVLEQMQLPEMPASPFTLEELALMNCGDD